MDTGYESNINNYNLFHCIAQFWFYSSAYLCTRTGCGSEGKGWRIRLDTVYTLSGLPRPDTNPSCSSHTQHSPLRNTSPLDTALQDTQDRVFTLSPLQLGVVLFSTESRLKIYSPLIYQYT